MQEEAHGPGMGLVSGLHDGPLGSKGCAPGADCPCLCTTAGVFSLAVLVLLAAGMRALPTCLQQNHGACYEVAGEPNAKPQEHAASTDAR